MTAAACGGNDEGGGETGGGGGGVTGGQLVYGFETAYPDNWFPVIAAGNSVATAYAEIRVLLAPFRTFPDFTIHADPDLVVGEPTSETTGGKQVVTYKINPAAVWSDGDQIDAKDFRFTWELQKSSDPKTGGCPDLISTTGYDQIESVEGADNDKTVTVTYAKPFSDWKSLFTLYPQHVMDKGDPKANCAAVVKGWPAADGVPVASGPFLLDKAGIDVNKKIATLTRNEKFWGEKPKLDRIVLQGIGNDPGVSVKALRNNEVQLIYPQPQLDLVKNIKDLEPAVTSKTNFGLTFEHLDFNTTDELLGQKVVRQAIAYALNRPDLVAKTVGQFDNRAQVLNNRYFVNNQPEYEDTSGGLYDKQDVAKAQQLLEGAGFAKGSDGIYAKGGKRLSFELMTTQANPLRNNTIDVITQQLKPAGIEIKKFLNPDIFAGKEKPRSLEGGQFQIALFAWVSAPYVSGNQSIYQTPKGDNIGQNYSRAGNPKVDALFPQINAATDQAQIKELGNQIDKLLWEDLYTIPLYQKPTFIAYNSNYTGIEENATNAGPLWDATKFARKA
ncbi:MAG TPA: ABC transporter family substrate-binding protein [Actinoplanes sp.]|nr:ABC transporter family substrate-binding protein [Actinoplanes sp.]